MAHLQRFNFTLTNGDAFFIDTNEDVFNSVGKAMATGVAYTISNQDGTANLINPAHIVRIDQINPKENQ